MIGVGLSLAAVPDDVKLLAEIPDLLKAQAKPSTLEEKIDMFRKGTADPSGQPEEDKNLSRSDQRQEDRQQFGRGGSAERYQMREKMLTIGDDFWIENEQGRRAYKVDGKLLRIRDILVFEDPNGKELVKMASKLIQIRDQVKLERTGGPSN